MSENQPLPGKGTNDSSSSKKEHQSSTSIYHEIPWPPISPEERTLYENLFYSQGPVDGYILGEGVRELLLKSGLSLTVLSQIWNLADVSNDNVLNVQEFVLAIHLIRGRMRGLTLPKTLPRCLTPPKCLTEMPPPMSQQEKDAYLRVFQTLDFSRSGSIEAGVAMELLVSSKLPHEVIAHIWDLSDFGRDGKLSPEEFAIACHLVRYANAGGSLAGPVDIFRYAPQHVSPISLLARKRRVAEYQEHKQRLMSLKERRRQQATRESRRFDVLKEKITCLEELAELLQTLGKVLEVDGSGISQVLTKDREDVQKQEEIVVRLKKEHEKVRQETVKIILREHKYTTDISLIKQDTDELSKRLSCSHSHATKDPDPFHQLYEQRKEKRQGSTIKDLDKINIHIPFDFSPFDLKVTPDTLPSGTRILLERESNGNNSFADLSSVIADVKGFGDKFMDEWGSLASPSLTMANQTSSLNGKEFEDDEIFKEVNEDHDDRWPVFDWSSDGLFGLTNEQVIKLKTKLGELKEELTKLNTDHRRLVFRNPADYEARRIAREEEEKAERGRINRRSTAERIRTNSLGSAKVKREAASSRYSLTDRSTSEAALAAREYRLKRRLDSTSSSPEGSHNPDRLRRLTKSSAGSPSSPSDEASLSRQSSLSSTDQASSLRGSNPHLDEELTGKTHSSRTDDSGILTLRSSRRKDDLSLELASVALGRPIQVEATPPPVSKLETTQLKEPTRLKDGIQNIQSSSAKSELITQTLSHSEIENSQIVNAAKQSKLSTKKKTRAPLPPSQPPANVAVPSTEAVTEIPSSQLSDHLLKFETLEAQENILPHSLSNVANTLSFANEVKANGLAPEPHKQKEPPNPPPPTRPPRVRKKIKSFESSDTKPSNPASKETVKPIDNEIERGDDVKVKEKLTNIHSVSSDSRRPSKKRQAPTPAEVNEKQIASNDTETETKSRFILAPDSPQSSSDADVGITFEAKPAFPEENMLRLSQSTNKASPSSSRSVKATSQNSPTMSSNTPDRQMDNISISEPSDSDTEGIPPPLPNSAPPPLPSVAPPNPGDMINTEGEMSVEYSVSSHSEPILNGISNSAVAPSSTPSSTPPLMKSSSPPPTETPSHVSTISELRSNFFGIKSSARSSGSRSTSSDIKSFYDDLTESREATSLDVYFNDLQTEAKLNSDAKRHTNDSDDSDLSDSDNGVQRGRYDVFSPGDSGIMTSSVASTPDEADSNIELVNYTPYNDINTNNNYITTNFNFVNIDDNSYVNRDNMNLNNTINTPNDNSNPNGTIENIDNTTANTGGRNFTRDAPTRTNAFITSDNFISVSTMRTETLLPMDTEPSPLSSKGELTLESSAPTAISVSMVQSASTLSHSCPQSSTPKSSLVSSKETPEREELMISSKAPVPSENQPKESKGIENSYKLTDSEGREESESTWGEIDVSSLPIWSDKGSTSRPMSSRSQEIVEKARQFADMVQPRQTVVLKLERPEEEFPKQDRMSLVQERRDVISQTKVMRKTSDHVMSPVDEPASLKTEEEEDLVRSSERNIVSPNPSDYGFTYSSTREQPPPEVGWRGKDKEEGLISLYSENVLKEGDTTDEVNRESIANLSTTRKQWETIFSSAQQEETHNKKKTTPKWEVRLPTKGRSPAPSPADDRHTTDNSSVPVEKEAEVMSGPRDSESAIEYEIRLAKEREEMLRREKEEREQHLEKQPKSQGQTIIASYEAVSSESEAYQPAYHELAEADRGPDLWSTGDMNKSESTYEINGGKEVDPNESIIEREIRLQKERESEIQKQRQMSTPCQEQKERPQELLVQEQSSTQSLHHQPPEHISVVESEVIPGENYNSDQEEDMSETADVAYEDAIAGAQHQGESIIARELRELKEREEEMKRLRMSLQNNHQTQPKETTSASTTAKSNGHNSVSPTRSFSKTSSHGPAQGTWQRDVSPFVSQKRRESLDSSSSHSGTGRNSMEVGGSTRNVKVHPTADGDEKNEPVEKPDYFKKQETPIEREMRLARERENELRRMKGMPEIVEKKEDTIYGSYSPSPEPSNSPLSRTSYRSQQNQHSIMKKLGANRLQQEINAQTEREMALRSEGKIISTSEEHIQPLKYMEVTGTDRISGSEKRNFSTKRLSATNSPSEAQDPQMPRESPLSSTVQSQASKKSASSGGQLFSYREFKQTAESKIERELREMREREEELRNQRKSSTAETPQ